MKARNQRANIYGVQSPRERPATIQGIHRGARQGQRRPPIELAVALPSPDHLKREIRPQIASLVSRRELDAGVFRPLDHCHSAEAVLSIQRMNGIDKERVKHTRLALMRRQRTGVFHRPDPGPGPVPEPDTPDQPPQPLPTPPIPPEPPVRREQSKSFRN